MGNFNEAIKIVLDHEGSQYTNKPHDKGGPTKYGITEKTLDNYRMACSLPTYSVGQLTESEAKEIYRKGYWDVMKLDQVNDHKLCNVMMDLGVLHGPQKIVKVLQRLLLDIDEDDGVVGPRTLDAINASTTFKGQKVNMLPLWVMQDVTEDLFMDAIREPTQAQFLPGWLARINSLLKFAVD